MLYAVRIPACFVTLGALFVVIACGGGGDSVPAELKDVCTQEASAATTDITVTTPESGADVSSPARVSGTINASQGQFFFAIVGADGTHITDYPGHASQTGTPVPFEQDLPFFVEEETPACLWVSKVNTPGPLDAVRIPINLLPAATPGS